MNGSITSNKTVITTCYVTCKKKHKMGLAVLPEDCQERCSQKPQRYRVHCHMESHPSMSTDSG